MARRYEQRQRAETADATRRRILDAVYERLREAPAQPVSVDHVARAAGVSRSTVYLIFGSRTGLFDALAADLYARTGYDRLVEAVGHPDAREHLRGGFLAGFEMLAAERDVVRALFSMARLDATAAGDAIVRWDDNRARGMARLARKLDEQGELRPDVTQEQAAHLLWVLTSFDSFDLLFMDRGLSVPELTDLLVLAAERTLLRDPA